MRERKRASTDEREGWERASMGEKRRRGRRGNGRMGEEGWIERKGGGERIKVRREGGRKAKGEER